ncbi:50S ribosomal protein L29 [Candidatus Phytoplasma phoenicium]|uniref:Large ribosomal subunit protein uL29 n=1 Tax=Candidatus Phytoplasma phoenicium TaxID=198422 RepID=A0A0L0ML95_9MOLU|nr:50S ribosomal protein L29 [Candidatus Phytoplasma phoenicium]KND62784.1 50S ribosomal protein L29 [Candidatus Phytoplasma phoenicium]
MKIKEMRQMNQEELNNKIFEFKKRMFTIKLEIDLAKTKNTSLVSKMKKNIARLNTVIREKNFLLTKNINVSNSKKDNN